MSACKAIAVFLGWLIVAFFGLSVVTIYGFDYFEGALGGRADNLLLSVVAYAATALAITAGFAAVLLWRRPVDQSCQGMRLLIAAVVACGLVHVFALAGPFLDHFRSWQLNLGLFALYSVLVGAVIAVGLIRFTKDQRYAA
jgi:hypothetical protein